MIDLLPLFLDALLKQVATFSIEILWEEGQKQQSRLIDFELDLLDKAAGNENGREKEERKKVVVMCGCLKSLDQSHQSLEIAVT